MINILEVTKPEFCATFVAVTGCYNATYCRLCYSIATYLLADVMRTLVYIYLYWIHLATNSEQTLKYVSSSFVLLHRKFTKSLVQVK
jgi:hypothetical protein